jgi:hypothetical protein
MTIDSNPRSAGGPQESMLPVDAAAIERLADLLREAEQEHHKRPAADWPRWYAAYVCERQVGASVEDAADDADRFAPEQPK